MRDLEKFIDGYLFRKLNSESKYYGQYVVSTKIQTRNEVTSFIVTISDNINKTCEKVKSDMVYNERKLAKIYRSSEIEDLKFIQRTLDSIAKIIIDKL